MNKVVASAPGKAVLCGEYAVLDGAPAVCMALDRRARVTVTPCEGEWIRVSAPGYTAVEGLLRVVGETLEWSQGASEFALVDAVLRTTGAIPERVVSIELDSNAFRDGASNEKIGIGSSAALTVALLAALRGTEDVFADAIGAHRQLQQGAGSGVDIATSVHGGLLEYRMAAAEVTALQWPAGLQYRLVWSGVAADTRAKLAQLDNTAESKARTELLQAAIAMATAWSSATRVLNEYPAYIECLRRFSVDHGLGIFDAGHDELCKAAADAGLVYKPCGAGGGDVGILLGRSGEQLDDFMAGRQQTLHCELDPVGVKLEQR
jgi:phosphomevalonate kinase